MTEQETAETLGVSLRTVERDWPRARAWLQKELG
jgi:DNA-directed RNA polymerase specialized sigma24 family protein